MSFQGVYVNKLNGGLVDLETTDRVAVLIAGAAPIEDKLQNNVVYPLLQITDAETLGLTPQDAANGNLVYYHLSEIFRLSPQTTVNLITVPTATKVSDLKNLTTLIDAIRSIDGINTIAVTGLTKDTDLQTAVSGLQILVDNLATDFIYIDTVLLEGTGEYLPDTITSFTDLREFDSPNVSVIVGQDPGIASLNELNENYASVGSALGMLMVRAVHENLGSVDIEIKPRSRRGEENYTLTDVRQGLYTSASLSNGKPFSTLSGPDQKQLDLLGYIYIRKFEGYFGYYFSNSHTSVKTNSDYAFIERNAIWNKAARIIRNTLIPKIRSKVESDPATGYIASTTITYWDGLVRKTLETMVTARNISAFDIYINPQQYAVSTQPFNIKVELVADGVVHEFEIDLGFTNQI